MIWRVELIGLGRCERRSPDLDSRASITADYECLRKSCSVVSESVPPSGANLLSLAIYVVKGISWGFILYQRWVP